MKDEDSRAVEMPAGWVTYDPEKPLYEIQHLCMHLSDLQKYFSTDQAGNSEEKDI